MLLTPFGELSTLDLNDQQTQQKVLFYDKHTLLEGLVAENHVDQIFEATVQNSARLVRLNVTSVFSITTKAVKPYVLVLDQGCDPALLKLYLAQLALAFNVKLVRYETNSKRLMTHTGPYAEEVVLDASYGSLVSKLNANPDFGSIASEIRNPTRQMQGFWGQLVGAYGTRMGPDIVLPRLFKNFAVQPYFDRGTWDIDRVFWDSETELFSVLEVKHKYPSDREFKPLQFGINVGSAEMLLSLAKAGFKCFHAIMVKPYWDKAVSVTVLFNNLEARKHVFFCGKNFDIPMLQTLAKGSRSSAPAETSLDGRRKLAFVLFEASSLYSIGLLDDRDLSERFAMAITDQLQERVTDDQLRSHRLHAIP